MARQIHVKVTQADIDAGVAKDSARCVVATAIARTLPGASRIGVDVQTVRFTDADGVRRVYLVPPAVAGYVVAFDAGEDLVPFDFRLREEQRVNVRTQRRTDEGKAKARADNKARAAKRKAERDRARAEATADDPTVPEVERRAAATAAEASAAHAETAAEERAAVMAAYEHAPTREPGQVAGTRKPTPHVFKRNERAYGMRQLRINGGGSSGVTGD